MNGQLNYYTGLVRDIRLSTSDVLLGWFGGSSEVVLDHLLLTCFRRGSRDDSNVIQRALMRVRIADLISLQKVLVSVFLYLLTL